MGDKPAEAAPAPARSTIKLDSKTFWKRVKSLYDSWQACCCVTLVLVIVIVIIIIVVVVEVVEPMLNRLSIEKR